MSPILTGERGIFRSLTTRNYRLFAAGQVVSNTGTWAQRVAQDWLVLELSDNSGTALGIVTALQFLPLLLFGLWGGVLADRYSKRALLIGSQAAMGVLALLLGVLDLSGVVALWHVYLLAALLGVASVIDVPARQSFVVEMVGHTDLPNAVSLNSAIFNGGRIVGPAVAGFAIASVGTGAVFVANAVSFIAVVGSLLAMRSEDLQRSAPVARARGQLREGLLYVRHTPDLLMPIILVGIVGTFGLNFQITMALMAKTTFNQGASGLGLLSSMLALGSLIGAIGAARRVQVRHRLLLGSAFVFGVLEMVVGLMPTYLTFALLLIPTGFAVITFTTAANAMVQLVVSAEMRGRVMAIYILVFLGTTPIGAPLIGLLAEMFGPRSSIVLGGAVCTLSALAITLLLVRQRQLQVRPHVLRRHPHVHVHAAAVGGWPRA